MKVRNMHYRMGDNLSTCDRCGFTYYGSELMKEWTGLMVCKPCFDPRHPQDFVRATPDKQSVPDARPIPEPYFLAINEVTKESL